jgi:hypothetical protein
VREAESLAVALEHLHAREQVVPDRDRLRALEVRVAGHVSVANVARLLCGTERALERSAKSRVGVWREREGIGDCNELP